MKLKSLSIALIMGLAANVAPAAMILVDLMADGTHNPAPIMENDGINADGSAQLADMLGGVTVYQLDRVNWDFTAPLINPQTSGDLTVTGTVFNDDPDVTEATAGTWNYSGASTINYLTLKFDGWVAVFEVTNGDISGAWDTSAFGTDFMHLVGGKKNSSYKPFAVSHMAAYSTTVIPLPATVWLLGSGLLLLLGVSRRQRP